MIAPLLRGGFLLLVITFQSKERGRVTKKQKKEIEKLFKDFVVKLSSHGLHIDNNLEYASILEGPDGEIANVTDFEDIEWSSSTT